MADRDRIPRTPVRSTARWRLAPDVSLGRRLFLSCQALGLAILASGADATLLDEILERGAVRCGVLPDLAGFAEADSLGRFRGFDVDVCHAVAAAVTGDPQAVEFVPLAPGERRGALEAGRVDLLTHALERLPTTSDAAAGAGATAGRLMIDGQTFLSPARSRLRSALELDGKRVCVVRGEADRALMDFASSADIGLQAKVETDLSSAFSVYLEGGCNAVSANRSELAALRSRTDEPADHGFLSETFTNRPMGLLVAEGDASWRMAVLWTRHCLVSAETLGVTAENTAERARDGTLAARTLLGAVDDIGARLGLRRDWCEAAIRATGHYGEMHARHLGVDSPLGLARGLDETWTEGGLLYAPPIR